MKQIAKAVIQVMTEVKGMEKNTTVGSGRNSYNGTKDQDVKEVFNEALAKNGLCMIPTSIEDETQIDRWSEETQYGVKQKQSVFTKVKTKYLLLHTSGESIEVAGYGHGVDTQDKGAGKATTYAMKNALLYTFMTPVGKIDDTETTHSNDVATPVKKAPVKTTPKKDEAPAKPFLLESHKSWKNVCEYLEQPDTKGVEEVKKKFILTPDVEEILKAIMPQRNPAKK